MSMDEGECEEEKKPAQNDEKNDIAEDVSKEKNDVSLFLYIYI